MDRHVACGIVCYRCGGGSGFGCGDLILGVVEIALLGWCPVTLGEAGAGGPAIAVTIVAVGLTPGAAGGAAADYGFVEGGEAIAAVVAVGGEEVEVAAGGLSGPLAGLGDVAVVGAGTIGPFEAELVVGGGAAGLEGGVGPDALAL